VLTRRGRWANFRSLFAPEARVWTTWSGPRSVDDFINISKEGKKVGVFIMHRECGTLVELNRSTNRAVGKMKATITQRFKEADGTEYDVDCDCRFIFFCAKAVPLPVSAEAGSPAGNGAPHGNGSHQNGANGHHGENGSSSNGNGAVGSVGDGEWKAHFVKLFYEKDKIVPADGISVPRLTSDELMAMEDLPEGYKYLGIMQKRLGYKIDLSLPTPRNDGWGNMYAAMEAWLDGAETIDL